MDSREGGGVSEQKPIYYTLDDNELYKLRKITINGEPLSTKQLHELITSQAMTIDRLLGDVERYRAALKEIANIYEDGGIRLTTMTDRCVQIAQNTLKDAG